MKIMMMKLMINLFKGIIDLFIFNLRYQQNSQKILENIKNKQNTPMNNTEKPTSINTSNYNPQAQNQNNNYMAPPGQSLKENTTNTQKVGEYNISQNNEMNKQPFASQGEYIKNGNLNQSYYSISKKKYQNNNC
jgi:hypothetical protein